MENKKITKQNFFSFQCKFPRLKLTNIQSTDRLNNFKTRYMTNRIPFSRQFYLWVINTIEISLKDSNCFIINLKKIFEPSNFIFGSLGRLNNIDSERNINRKGIRRLIKLANEKKTP
jgi:hypothetical protein